MLKQFSFLLVICVLLFTGCEDEDSSPIIVFDELEIGAFPRLQELRTAEFDLANLNSSVYEHVVDFVDGNGGQNVAQYNVYVSFDDNNEGNGTIDGESMLYRSVTPSEFTLNDETGNLGFTLTIPFSDVAQFVGAGNDGDVVSGDRFQFTTEIVTEDGTVFSSANSTPAVTNAFRGIWNFNVNATCPLEDDAFAGDYNVTYGEVYDEFPLFGAPVTPFGTDWDATVTLSTVAGSSTRRSVNFGPYLVPGYNFASGDVTLEFACDVVTSSNIDSGAGCGDGSIQASQTGVASFDLDDDGTWTIEYLDFTPNGGCGTASMPFSIVFTKI